MLRYIAHLAIAAPRRIIAVAVLVMVGAAVFGIPGIMSLSAAGFQDPTAESARAAELLSAKFGRGDLQIIFMVTSENGAQSLAARAVGTDIVEQLRASPVVAEVDSAWTAPPAAAAPLISKDGKSGLVVAGITGGGTDGQKHAKAMAERLGHDRDGVTVRVGGPAMAAVQINAQSERDLLLM